MEKYHCFDLAYGIDNDINKKREMWESLIAQFPTIKIYAIDRVVENQENVAFESIDPHMLLQFFLLLRINFSINKDSMKDIFIYSVHIRTKKIKHLYHKRWENDVIKYKEYKIGIDSLSGIDKELHDICVNIHQMSLNG